MLTTHRQPIGSTVLVRVADRHAGRTYSLTVSVLHCAVAENGLLRVEGRIDYSKYEGLDPLYTEYNIGHFARSFTLSNKIDQQQISAQLEDGVLTLTLKKAKEAMPRRIAIS